MSTALTRLEDLTPDTENANKGTARGRALLELSLERHGAARSIVVDRDGNIIAGNKTHEVAVERGLGMRVVETTGHELVVVKRTDLSIHDLTTRQLAVLDNRVAQIDLDWDTEQLLAHVEQGMNLDDVGFRESEVADLLGDDAAAAVEQRQAAESGTDGDVASTTDVRFAFGTHKGLVSKELYEKFAEHYNRLKQDSDAVMLDDVLRAWWQL